MGFGSRLYPSYALCACALGYTIAEAQNKAYRLVRNIDWDNVYYRTDIGFKAISRSR